MSPKGDASVYRLVEGWHNDIGTVAKRFSYRHDDIVRFAEAEAANVRGDSKTVIHGRPLMAKFLAVNTNIMSDSALARGGKRDGQI